MGDVRRLVPGAEVVVQLDEPSLPAVLRGGLPTVSGFGKLSAVEAVVVEAALTRVVQRLRAADVATVAVHCCAPDAPVGLLRAAGVDAVALDTSLLGPRAWSRWRSRSRRAPSCGPGWCPRPASCPRRASWSTGCTAVARRRPRADLLAGVSLTPACGLAGCTPAAPRGPGPRRHASRYLAGALAEAAHACPT